MTALVSYIRSIHGIAGGPKLTSTQYEESYEHEDEFELTLKTTDYHFADGTQIRCEREIEQSSTDDINAPACADVWSDYTVIKQPIAPAEPITPTTKRFANLCQEQFWLKIQP